ncbi:unnamed protein product [Arctia plantaginis]|uniref:Uncharacterized protein n=1 Tax=Arctia plantaginis TaxID=874455 RepID=A0A8S0Z8A8_ARCPL|nr:unnamed protein product [Arctia plantaginis]
MKFLAVMFAIVLVVQLADVAADKLPFNDLTGTHGQQLNLDNIAFAIVLVVQLADVAADKLPFNDLTETHGQQLNLDNKEALLGMKGIRDIRNLTSRTTTLLLCSKPLQRNFLQRFYKLKKHDASLIEISEISLEAILCFINLYVLK